MSPAERVSVERGQLLGGGIDQCFRPAQRLVVVASGRLVLQPPVQFGVAGLEDVHWLGGRLGCGGTVDLRRLFTRGPGHRLCLPLMPGGGTCDTLGLLGGLGRRVRLAVVAGDALDDLGSGRGVDRRIGLGAHHLGQPQHRGSGCVVCIRRLPLGHSCPFDGRRGGCDRLFGCSPTAGLT